MWSKLKHIFSKPKEAPKPTKNYNFKWYEVGPENPFPVRILDIRSFTQTIIATTKDAAVATSYATLRGSDGKDLKNATIADSTWVATALTFPHNGTVLDGIVFKAESMDVKWDIYIYDGVFLFARSWTGELLYRARMRIEPSSITITEIECPKSVSDIAPANVYFLVATHAMKRVLPHQLQSGVPDDPMAMATLSFNLFGNRGCYATFDDITRIPITAPQI